MESFLNPISIWFIIGGILLMVELAMPGLIVFFFGLGCFVTGTAYFLLPDLTINYQLSIFILSSIILLAIFRKLLRHIFSGLFKGGDKSYQELGSNIGEHAVVSEDIKLNQTGCIEFHGSNWKAVADEEIKSGTQIKIIKQDNITFTVEKI